MQQMMQYPTKKAEMEKLTNRLCLFCGCFCPGIGSEGFLLIKQSMLEHTARE
jgi:hypothetical protein